MLDEAAQAASLPFVAGMSCNPTLLSRALGASLTTRAQVTTHLQALAALLPGPMFVQVLATEAEGMIEDAHFLRSVVGPERAIIKLPSTPEGLIATRRLADQGVATCTTAIYSLLQAYVAASCGATWLAPYCNRITQAGGDGVVMVGQMRDMLKAQGLSSRLLVASVKSVAEMEQILRTGADHVTVALPLLLEASSHRLARDASARFASDLSWA